MKLTDKVAIDTLFARDGHRPIGEKKQHVDADHVAQTLNVGGGNWMS